MASACAPIVYTMLGQPPGNHNGHDRRRCGNLSWTPKLCYGQPVMEAAIRGTHTCGFRTMPPTLAKPGGWAARWWADGLGYAVAIRE